MGPLLDAHDRAQKNAHHFDGRFGLKVTHLDRRRSSHYAEGDCFFFFFFTARFPEPRLTLSIFLALVVARFARVSGPELFLFPEARVARRLEVPLLVVVLRFRRVRVSPVFLWSAEAPESLRNTKYPPAPKPITASNTTRIFCFLSSTNTSSRRERASID